MNAEQDVPDIRPLNWDGWGLRFSQSSAVLVQGAHPTGALEEPQTVALCNSLWPKTLIPSLHLLAGPTHAPEASSLNLSW